jgi:MFS family permease
MGFIFVASVPLSAQWFNRRRSLANATAAAGSGFGGLTYSLATNRMIETIGLPWTFRTLGIICLVVNGVCAFLVRDRNEAVGSIHVAFNWKLFKHVPYLLMEMWMVFSILGYIILVFSIADYCHAVGLTASEASLVSALFNCQYLLPSSKFTPFSYLTDFSPCWQCLKD